MTDIVKITSPAKPLQVVSKINEVVDGVNNKQDKLVSGNNIKTINNTSLLGSGNIEITTGSSYTQGTGISIVNNTINHSNSITAGTVGTSSATSGSTLAVPYINYDSEGHITSKGTHTHTVTGFLTSSDVTSNYSQTGTDPINGTGVKKALDTLSIPTVTDTYSATSSNAMSGKAVASAISGKVNGAPLSNTSSHFFGVSTSAATDTEKVVSIPSITELTAGVAIIVLPTITSTVANATIKLNNFTAYPMRYQNAAITTSTDAYTWTANTPSVFVFDGNYWRFVCQGYRQVYSAMSVSEGTTGTATTGRIVRADYLKSIILGTKLTGLSTSTTGTIAATDTVLVGMGKLQATKADKSAIPTVNNATLTIQKNGTTVNTFTANASSNVTANITVPTQASDIGAQATLVSGTNIKTINNESILGSGNIEIDSSPTWSYNSTTRTLTIN